MSLNLRIPKVDDAIIRAIVGPQLDLLDDLYFWVIGLYEDGTPRQPLTIEDCQNRFETLIPKKGTIESLQQLVEEYKPRCECGRMATVWYNVSEVVETYPKNLLPKKTMITTTWTCDEHKKDEKGVLTDG